MTRATLVVAGWCACVAVAAAQDGASTSPRATAACVALAFPTVQGATGSATDVAAAVRDLFANYLQGPKVTVISLETKLASQANDEARQKSCDRVLVASLSRKRGSGGSVLGRALGQAGATAAWGIPGAGIGGAVARAGVAGGAQAANEIAAGTRAKDEMRLEYTLVSPDGRVIVKPTEDKAKATVDGEDLLTPLVQRASEAIVTAVSSSR